MARSSRRSRATAPAAVALDDPLTVNVAGLLGEPSGTVRPLAIHDVRVTAADGLLVTRPLEGEVRLTRTNRGLLVRATITTALAGECRRCLRPVETPIELVIDEEARPSIDLTSGLPSRLEEGEDPGTTRLTDHHELELRPLVQEAISLAEPIAPLCEPDCPGLCPECGQRMTAGHEHPHEDIDPRLDALRAFKVDAPENTG